LKARVPLKVTSASSVIAPADPLVQPNTVLITGVSAGQATLVEPVHQLVPLVLQLPPPSCAPVVTASASHTSEELVVALRTAICTGAEVSLSPAESVATAVNST
jgi:hypothetical protein